METAVENWREVKQVSSWDQADAVRTGIMRDTPSLDVRIRSRWGQYIVEISGPTNRNGDK